MQKRRVVILGSTGSIGTSAPITLPIMLNLFLDDTSVPM